MSDIVERLRVPLPSGMCGQSMGCNAASICLCSEIEDGREIMREAADEIQSLRQRVERLEELLEIAVDDHDSHMGKSNVPAHWTNQARAALGGHSEQS